MMASGALARRPEQGAIHPVGVGTAPGTFGELLQGALGREAQEFLVTLPISVRSMVTFVPLPSECELTVMPAHKVKAKNLARLALERMGRPLSGYLRCSSALPEGKGLASSSADLVATARAVCKSVGVRATPGFIESLMREIEPSDGVMYDEIVVFHHRQVKLRQRLGRIPPLVVLGIDEGGVLDTLEFHARRPAYRHAEVREYEGLLAALTAAVAARDMETVGRIATRSAILNQRLAPKRSLDALLRISRDSLALGVVTAHSGTCSGLLFRAQDPRLEEKLEYSRRELQRLTRRPLLEHRLTQSCDGGGDECGQALLT
jgi:uncharacterized protein involved in propanediol utilization